MKIYVKEICDEEFIKQIIPKIIIHQLRVKSKDKKNLKMDKYLLKYYSITILDLVESLSNNFLINKINNLYVITINELAIEQKSKVKLNSLIKLVDYGNMIVKGVNLFNKEACNIAYYIEEIYKMYLIRGGNL